MNWSKIFRYRQDTGKIELAYQITSYQSINQFGGTSPYMLSQPDVSSDGRVVAYTAQGGSCENPGDTCREYVGAYGYLVGAARPSQLASGSVRLSRNGRYVYSFPYLTAANGNLRLDCTGYLPKIATYASVFFPVGP